MARTRTRSNAVEEVAEPQLPSPENRFPDLSEIIKGAAKRFGENVIMKGTAIPGFNCIESGVFTLDLALLGGIPEGCVTQIFGYASAGKSTMTQRFIGSAQRKYPDKAAVLIDCERTYSKDWGSAHGVDNERLLYAQPPSGEAAVDIVDAILQTPEASIVIIDSLPALIPMKEAEDSAEDTVVAVRARLIGRLCSKIHYHKPQGLIKNGYFPTIIFVNQYRQRLSTGRGDPNILPGGMQKDYTPVTSIRIRNKEVLASNARGIEIVSHNEHAFTVVKHKVGNSARNGEFTMIRDPAHPLGQGAIDNSPVVVTYGKKFGLITGGGASWRIDGDETSFRRLDEITAYFNENPEAQLDMQRRIIMAQRQEMGLHALPPDSYLCGAYLEME